MRLTASIMTMMSPFVASLIVSSQLLLGPTNNKANAFSILSPTSLPSFLSRSHESKVSLSMSADDINGGGMGELTSALATLDQQWQIQQRNRRGGGGGTIGGWTMLKLDSDSNDGTTTTTTTQTTPEDILNPFMTPPSAQQQAKEDFVYLLEPSVGTPSCVLLFLGGAGLGQFPHIAYNELLTRISKRLNAAIIASPYEVGLDHFDLAKKTGEKIRKALIACEDERGYSAKIPKFVLGHSLGAKLQTITMAASSGVLSKEELAGVGFMSFNNFGFSDTIGMAKSFAKELRNDRVGKAVGNEYDDIFSGTGMGGGGGGGMPQDNAMFDMLLNFAEQAVGAVGMEFTPSPEDTKRMITMKYDSDLQAKTRLFVFDDDDLDSSLDLMGACGTGNGLTVSGLPGTHLTPVFIKFGLEDLDLPEEARDIAGQFTGGFQGASFGNEENLNEAVDEICNWVLGKGPSRRPNWEGKETSTQTSYQPSRRLTGEVVDAEIE